MEKPVFGSLAVNIGAAIIAGLALYYIFGIGKNTTPSVQATSSNVAIGNSGSLSQTINNYPPPTFDYLSDSPSIVTPDGKYRTDFVLQLKSTPGINPSFSFDFDKEKMISCATMQAAGQPLTIVEFTDQTNGLVTRDITVRCLSNEAITDDGSLFQYTP